MCPIKNNLIHPFGYYNKVEHYSMQAEEAQHRLLLNNLHTGQGCQIGMHVAKLLILNYHTSHQYTACAHGDDLRMRIYIT